MSPKTVDEATVIYACRCSRAKLLESLSTLTASEVESLLDNGTLTASCTYCNQLYRFEGSEILGHDPAN